MAGLTPDENIGKALILLGEAVSCLEEAQLRGEPPGHSRSFPFPEMRQVLREMRRAHWDLEHYSGCHPPYVREYEGQWQS